MLNAQSSRLLHRLGFADLDTLLGSGSVEQITAYILGTADRTHPETGVLGSVPMDRLDRIASAMARLGAEERHIVVAGGPTGWNWAPRDQGNRWDVTYDVLATCIERIPSVARSAEHLHHLHERRQTMTGVAAALLDKGLPAEAFLAPGSMLARLVGDPTIYGRIIDTMSVANLSGRSGNLGGPMGWYQIMWPVVRRYPRPDQQVDVLLDIVVRLRAKGIEVSAKLVNIELGTQPVDTNRYGKEVAQALERVEVEIRRRERAALGEVADLAMAEAPEAPAPRARARL
ncbi:hypothetical protein [Burkholderia anthina]|uniref:hypothetical protein n=1 Tax=Burkholderia anthina TaxID=179879 RepID=UPI0037BE50A7